MDYSATKNMGFSRCVGVVIAMLLGGVASATQTVPSTLVSTDTPKTAPTLTVLSGDNQTGTPGEFNSKPFDVAVWNPAGTEPLVDTEVTFTVQSGGGLPASSKDAAVPSYTLTLKTDQDGTVQAYYKQPFVPELLSQVKATAADGEVLLATRTLALGETLDGSTGETGNPSGTTKSGTSSGGSGAVIGFASAGTSATSKSSITKPRRNRSEHVRS